MHEYVLLEFCVTNTFLAYRYVECQIRAGCEVKAMLSILSLAILVG